MKKHRPREKEEGVQSIFAGHASVNFFKDNFRFVNQIDVSLRGKSASLHESPEIVYPADVSHFSRLRKKSKGIEVIFELDDVTLTAWLLCIRHAASAL